MPSEVLNKNNSSGHNEYRRLSRVLPVFGRWCGGKLPFQKFKNGEGVLVFYVSGHMFSFFDCNDFSVISLKCQPERIEDLKAQHECIGNPYNESPKHWIGINPATAPDGLLKELTQNSYEIVKAKYTKRKWRCFSCNITDTINACPLCPLCPLKVVRGFSDCRQRLLRGLDFGVFRRSLGRFWWVLGRK